MCSLLLLLCVFRACVVVNSCLDVADAGATVAAVVVAAVWLFVLSHLINSRFLPHRLVQSSRTLLCVALLAWLIFRSPQDLRCFSALFCCILAYLFSFYSFAAFINLLGFVWVCFVLLACSVASCVLCVLLDARVIHFPLVVGCVCLCLQLVAWWLLLAAGCSLLVSSCSLLVACCSLPVTCCICLVFGVRCLIIALAVLWVSLLFAVVSVLSLVVASHFSVTVIVVVVDLAVVVVVVLALPLL